MSAGSGGFAAMALMGLTGPLTAGFPWNTAFLFAAARYIRRPA